MNSRIFRNKSTFGFYSPQNKNSININEVEVLKDKILKLKIELNKKNFECQELRIMYNKLDKAYKSNIILLEKLLKEANNNIINTNFSYCKENEEKKGKEKEKEKEKENNNKLEDINKNKNTNKSNSPKNKSRSVETNKSNKSLNLNFKNNFLLFANKNHLTMKLQQEIYELKKEVNEKDNKINNLKKNANILKYKELDKKYAKIYTELMGTRENNEKLEIYCLNINSKINNYKEKIKKLNNKKILIEDENYALKQKIDKIENINNNKNQGNNKKNCENEKENYQKKNNLVKNEEDIEKLKEKINLLEKENKELKEKLKNNENNFLLENKNE